MKSPKNRMISKTQEAKPETGNLKPEAPGVVTVRVVRQAVGENGRTYLKGETFETTPERARALGSLVNQL